MSSTQALVAILVVGIIVVIFAPRPRSIRKSTTGTTSNEIEKIGIALDSTQKITEITPLLSKGWSLYGESGGRAYPLIGKGLTGRSDC